MPESENNTSGELEQGNEERGQGDNQPDRHITGNRAGLWQDLKSLMQSVVERMNTVEELRNRTGGLEYQIGSADQIIVNNSSTPAMSLTVSLHPSSIEICITIEFQAPSLLKRETRQTLDIDEEMGHTLLRNIERQLLTVEEAVYQILRPFLHVGTISN